MDMTQQKCIGISRQFDCYIKTCLRNEVRKINDRQNAISEHEVLFSDLPEGYVEHLCAAPEQDLLLHTFQALHYPVSVENDRLSEALRRLPEQKRTIILLYYFLDMNDGEISQRLHLPHKNITKTRQRTLNSLKKNMEDSNDEI